MTRMRKIEDTGDVLKAENIEIKTTSAKARSVPVYILKSDDLFLVIVIYYSIQPFPTYPHKVTLQCDLDCFFITQVFHCAHHC